MDTVRQVFHQTSRLAFLFAGLGSKAALAAAQSPGGAAAGGGPGAGPASTHDIWLRIYDMLAAYGLKVVGALVILLLGRWIARLLSALLGRTLTRAKLDPTLVSFIDNLSYTVMLVFVIVAALANAGVQTASVVAVLGAAGLAIGLALQGSLSNFASGVLLLVFKPFRVNDVVEVAGTKGTVQAIHVFNTVLNSSDNVRIIVPNGQVTGARILNYTINGTRQLDLAASVAPGNDLVKTRQAIARILTTDARVLPAPAALVAVSATAAAATDFVVRPWVKTTDYSSVCYDLTEKLKTALEQQGIAVVSVHTNST
jgi:small conductance mechanosensitive channel